MIKKGCACKVPGSGCTYSRSLIGSYMYFTCKYKPIRLRECHKRYLYFVSVES